MSNPYTVIQLSALSGKWSDMMSLVPLRDRNLQHELSRQESEYNSGIFCYKAPNFVI